MLRIGLRRKTMADRLPLAVLDCLIQGIAGCMIALALVSAVALALS